jgi:hypothetical protein
MRYFRSLALVSLVLLAALLPRRVKQALLPPRLAFYGHLICDGVHPAAARYRYPTRGEFLAFVRTLHNIGYEVVPFLEYIAKDDRKKVAFTFDDGFAEMGRFIKTQSFLRPQCFTLFVGGEDVSRYSIPGVSGSADDLFLSDSSVADLRKLGVHVGYHGAVHQRLRRGYLENDVRALLGQQPLDLGKFSTPLAFAYPYCAPDYRELSDRLIREEGFQFIFGTQFNLDFPSAYERVSMDVKKSVPRFLNPCLLQLHVLIAKRLLGRFA